MENNIVPVVKPMRPYVIAACHQKGGVAKTTTVASLGAILAQDGHATLLIDLDPTANLTASFGINTARVHHSIADILLGNESIAGVALHTSLRGLDLVPSNADMATASRFLSLRPRYEHLLQASLQALTPNSYEYILIDCPPAVLPLTVSALTAADLAVIPIQCEYYSLQALDTMFKTIAQVRARSNPYLCFRLLIAMYDQRGTLHGRVLELVRERYGSAVFDTTIGFDSKLREAQLAGLPVTTFAPRSRATQQYQALAQELHAYVEKQTVSQSA